MEINVHVDFLCCVVVMESMTTKLLYLLVNITTLFNHSSKASLQDKNTFNEHHGNEITI